MLAIFVALPGTATSVAAEPADDIDSATLARPGPYSTEVREIVVPRPDGAGGDIPARLYIPLRVEDDTGGPVQRSWPAVAFGHGYLAPVELYETTLEHLASWGITVIAPRSGGELLPDHGRFASDLVAALDWVVREAARDEGWPGLPVDPSARGVSGHSMGGGAAVLAAAADPTIGAAATLAAAETHPSAISAAASLRSAALFVAASGDAITPIHEHQRPMYEAVSMAPAQLRIIEGGSHCGFLDRVVLAGLICDEATIDAADQRALSRAALVAWFLAVLSGDDVVAQMASPAAGSDGLSIESKGGPASS